ncbi:MAG: hypothetical protein ABI772_14760 [Bacteroidota bacterium]
MKKISLPLIISLLIVLIWSCTNNKKESCSNDLNPNGDSELALLMRDMTAHLESEKKLVESGAEPSHLPEEFDKILTATPSDSKQRGEHFQDFAKMYLDALTAYHNSTKENHSFAYNNLVKSCISCHENECPGPIKRIQKLLVEEKKNIE